MISGKKIFFVSIYANYAKKKFTIVNMHGCRYSSQYIKLPSNVWVISTCEDEILAANSKTFARLLQFKK